MRGVVLGIAVAACSFAPHGPDRVGGAPDAPGGGGSDAGSDGPSGPPTSPRLLTLTDPTATTNVTSLPVLVLLDATRIDYSKVADPKTQLRFHELDDDTTLPFEVASWNPGGQSEIWIGVHTLHFDQPNKVEMLFGAGVGGQDDRAGVWNGYKLVEHLFQNLEDSTDNHGAGSRAGPTIDPGKIGGAAHFHGGDGEELDVPSDGDLFDGWNAFTLDFWIYPDYTSSDLGSGNEPRLFDKGTGPVQLARLFSTPQGQLEAQVDFHFNAQISQHALDIPATQTWTHLAWSYDHGNQDLHFFVNGLPAGIQGIGNQSLLSDSTALALGAVSSVPVLDGLIDEFHVADSSRTPAFIHAQYLSALDQLVTYSAP